MQYPEATLLFCALAFIVFLSIFFGPALVRKFRERMHIRQLRTALTTRASASLLETYHFCFHRFGEVSCVLVREALHQIPQSAEHNYLFAFYSWQINSFLMLAGYNLDKARELYQSGQYDLVSVWLDSFEAHLSSARELAKTHMLPPDAQIG